jgi:hypothetical protein
MNRYILTTITILISICFINYQANACTNQAPIARILNPDIQYIGVGNWNDNIGPAGGRTAFFDGSGSYDPDNQQGNGITEWDWEIYKWNGNDYIFYSYYWDYEYIYLPFSEPGMYLVKLYVKDDDTPAAWSNPTDCCFVIAFDATISSESSYSAYGSGKDFTYDIKPEGYVIPGFLNDWVPDSVKFKITDTQNDDVYYETSLSTVVSNEPTINWNGKNNSDEWIEPGSYLAVIETKKYNWLSEFWTGYYIEEWGLDWFDGKYNTYYKSPPSFAFTQVGVNMSPTSGPPGTVVTLSLTQAGTGLLSDDSTVSITGIYASEGNYDTTETTINYPANKVYYNSSSPDEVKIVIGEELPETLWFLSNPQIYDSSTGSLEGIISINAGNLTFLKEASYQIYTLTELGTLEDDTFTAVSSITSCQDLVAQVLIKDEGLGSVPDSFEVTLQSCDSYGDPIEEPPDEDYADTSLTFTVYKVTSGGIPGYHTYRSSPDEPIVPYAFGLPGGLSETGNQYIYIEDDGSLEIKY